MKLLPSWELEAVGMEINEKIYNHLVWADDVLMFGGSLGMVSRIFVDLTRLMGEYGLSWKPESLEFFTNAAHFPLCDTLTLEVDFVSWTIPVRSEGFKVLGIWQTPDGNTTDAVGHRLNKGSQAFWRDSKIYMSTALPLQLRFDRYHKRVVPVVCHGSGSWTWCKGLALRLDRWEGYHLRRIARVKRKPTEDTVTYFRRAVRAAKKMHSEAGYPPLGVRVLRSIFSLLSRVVPKHINSVKPPTRAHEFLKDVVSWRGTHQWLLKQAVFSRGEGSDARNKRKWKHEPHYTRPVGSDSLGFL